MGRKGRPPKSLEDHERDGTLRKHRHKHLLAGENVEKVLKNEQISVLEPPNDLKPDELEVWHVIYGILGDQVGPAESQALRNFAWWLAELRRVQERVRKTCPTKIEYARAVHALNAVQERVNQFYQLFRMLPTDDKELSRRLAGLVKEAVNAAPAPAPGFPGNANGARVRTRPQTKLDQQGAPK